MSIVGYEQNYTIHKLSTDEIIILQLIKYLKDIEHGAGSDDHFNNIMMDSYLSTKIDVLLNKVDNDLDAIYYKVKI